MTDTAINNSAYFTSRKKMLGRAVTPLLVYFFVFFQNLPPGEDVWCAFARDEGFWESVERAAQRMSNSTAGPSSPATRLGCVG